MDFTHASQFESTDPNPNGGLPQPPFYAPAGYPRTTPWPVYLTASSDVVEEAEVYTCSKTFTSSGGCHEPNRLSTDNTTHTGHKYGPRAPGEWACCEFEVRVPHGLCLRQALRQWLQRRPAAPLPALCASQHLPESVPLPSARLPRISQASLSSRDLQACHRHACHRHACHRRSSSPCSWVWSSSSARRSGPPRRWSPSSSPSRCCLPCSLYP